MTQLHFAARVPITRGWSKDRKYCVTKEDGVKYLLRISAPERYESINSLFTMLRQADALEIPICRPVEFGVCREGVYSLYHWIDGVDAEDAVLHLPRAEQYALGAVSGKILKNIHSIPAPAGQENWYTRFCRKYTAKIRMYRECPVKCEGGEKLISYLESNRELLRNRPQCFQHGDYHIGNMMLERGALVVIDFDRFDFGDPWEEFNRIVWGAQTCPPFAVGQLEGYFGGRPPESFFALLAFYIASNTLSSVPWAMSFGKEQVEVMLRQAREVLSWYDGMRTTVPAWYSTYDHSS